MPHSPPGGGCRIAADMPLTLGNGVNKGLAIDAARHRATELHIVERRLVIIDEQVPIDAFARIQLADRLRHLAAMFFICGIVSTSGKVMSNFPAIKARFAVAGSLMIVYSIPSR